MAEDRDFIEEMQEEAQLRFGRTLSPAEAGMEFVKHHFETRIVHLKRLRPPDYQTVEEAAQRLSFERELYNKHDLATKAGR